MYLAVASNRQFLYDALSSIVECDPFTSRLFTIYESAMTEPRRQTLSLQVQRSDYMLHVPDGDLANAQLRQIEVNNMSSAFGILATECTRQHVDTLRKLWRVQGHTDEEINAALKAANLSERNEAADAPIQSLYRTW